MMNRKLAQENENRLIKMGYDLDELDRDNPFNQWMEDYDDETDLQGKGKEQ